ncbi:MAG: lactonase family protein [Bacteroidetes bacterium]|nr:MAG: lactonase family protein [Bacteroidota bacterium]
MPFRIFALFMLVLFSCQNNTEPTNHPFFLGTYTDGDSQGIYLYNLSDGGILSEEKLIAKSENPSFLAMDKERKYLLAVNELDSGTVESYKITADSLLLLSQSAAGGAHPCFITTNDQGYVLTANYTGGNTGLLRINSDGQLSPLLDTLQHFGQSITDRQQAPHAHSAWFAPNGSDIIAVDLGTDELWFSTIENDKLQPAATQQLSMEAGAGPRHLTFHPNGQWAYVINELNNSVTQVTMEESGEYTRGDSWSTLPEDFSGESYCADIHISSDGKFVYASNRGHNSLAIFGVDEADGSLSFIKTGSVRGEWPRNFALSPDENFLLVANQHSNNITCFKRNKESGLLEFVSEVEAPSPVCILFK